MTFTLVFDRLTKYMNHVQTLRVHEKCSESYSHLVQIPQCLRHALFLSIIKSKSFWPRNLIQTFTAAILWPLQEMLGAENSTRNHEARDCNWRYDSKHSSWIHPWGHKLVCSNITLTSRQQRSYQTSSEGVCLSSPRTEKLTKASLKCFV